jgi:hypothetical protein
VLPIAPAAPRVLPTHSATLPLSAPRTERRREEGLASRDELAQDELGAALQVQRQQCCGCLGFRGRNWVGSTGAIGIAVCIAVIVVVIIAAVVLTPIIMKLALLFA